MSILYYVPDLYALIGERDRIGRQDCFSLKRKFKLDNKDNIDESAEEREAPDN